MREIRRILCPVDLSDVSWHAMRHAVMLARWYDAKITVLHDAVRIDDQSGGEARHVSGADIEAH